ncbi:hypothetical protein IQ268_08700 [Oculatella sp. LEGE 06141]|uniref:hypothetical protein n=1 Tax=Oculatella sp. LEGE 06141 TaxID=1828648 RepID=UPI00188041F7|nr:hypothetical protein [Oculatella sp. LEGE 06141]MBE9178637.1 hypothetical protein [Oculatella sp. LEGE 06141]
MALKRVAANECCGITNNGETGKNRIYYALLPDGGRRRITKANYMALLNRYSSR